MPHAGTLDDLQLLPDSTPPLEVWLRCTACGRRGRYGLERAFLAPPEEADPPDPWDGFFVPEVLDCKHCGAADSYDLSGRERLQLTTQATIGRMFGFGNPRLVLARTRLFDGTVVTRATAAITHLRALAEAHPDDGALWRRLGNFQERVGRYDDAWDSWLYAFVIDDREFEAGYALARICLAEGEPEEAATIAEQALARLPGCHRDGERFESLVEGLLQVVQQDGRRSKLHVAWVDTRADKPRIRLSAVRLSELRRLNPLSRFLMSEELLTIVFTSDAPDEDPGELELWLTEEHEAVERKNTVLHFPARPPQHRKSRRRNGATARSR